MARLYGGNRRSHANIVNNGFDLNGTKVSDVAVAEPEVVDTSLVKSVSVEVTTGESVAPSTEEVTIPPAPASVEVTTGETVTVEAEEVKTTSKKKNK
jgi:hypothetical protein